MVLALLGEGQPGQNPAEHGVLGPELGLEGHQIGAVHQIDQGAFRLEPAGGGGSIPHLELGQVVAAAYHLVAAVGPVVGEAVGQADGRGAHFGQTQPQRRGVVLGSLGGEGEPVPVGLGAAVQLAVEGEHIVNRLPGQGGVAGIEGVRSVVGHGQHNPVEGGGHDLGGLRLGGDGAGDVVLCLAGGGGLLHVIGQGGAAEG